MNNSLHLFATLALIFLFDAQSVAAAEPPAARAKSAGARDQPAVGTPEGVLKEFLTAMVENDAAGVRRTALPDRELSVLWHSEPLTAAQKAIAKAELNPSNFRRLKVGDQVTIPDGRKLVLDENSINDRQQEITMPNAPVPFLLVKVKDEWKVDASPLIAARNAAAAAEERNKVGGRANWLADAKILDQLGNETTIDGLTFRPPAGFRPNKVPLPSGQSTGWTGTPRQNGFYPLIAISVIPSDADASRPISALLEESLAEIQKRYGTDWGHSPFELGRIDNLLSIRTRWSGTLAAGRKEFIGRKTRGVFYVIKHGRKFVQVMIQDAVPDADKSLPLCEASALTLRRVPDKH
jgi:hypothetical protein